MEIEKKYLLKKMPVDYENVEKLEIFQSYISRKPTIRIRQSNDDYILTIKGRGQLSRIEHELNITKEEFENLLTKTEEGSISKTRYNIPIDGNLVAELDIYKGELNGLFTVEVEFESVEAAEKFVPPAWFGKDVTFDSRYNNSTLYQYGIPKEV